MGWGCWKQGSITMGIVTTMSKIDTISSTRLRPTLICHHFIKRRCLMTFYYELHASRSTCAAHAQDLVMSVVDLQSQTTFDVQSSPGCCAVNFGC